MLEKLTLDHNLLIKLPANMGNMKKLKVGDRLKNEKQPRFYFSVGFLIDRRFAGSPSRYKYLAVHPQ